MTNPEVMRHEALDSWSRGRHALRMGLHSTRRTGCIWPVLFLRLCGQNPVDLWIEADGEPALRQRQFYRRQPDLSNRRGFSRAPREGVACAGAFPGALLPAPFVSRWHLSGLRRLIVFLPPPGTVWKLRVIRCLRWMSKPIRYRSQTRCRTMGASGSADTCLLPHRPRPVGPRRSPAERDPLYRCPRTTAKSY